METFAERVRKDIQKAQVENGMSNLRTAKLAKMSTSTFYRKLQKPETMTVEELGRISKALKMGSMKWE